MGPLAMGWRHFLFENRPIDEPFSAPNDPFGAYLVERYRFSTGAQDRSIRHTEVSHEPWTLYPAATEIETNTLLVSHGVGLPDADPNDYYSPGLDGVASPSKSA